MSVPPINPTSLAHSMGDPGAIGKHPMDRPMVHLNADHMDQVPDGPWGQVLVVASLLAVIVSLVLMGAAFTQTGG
jgi:hypothetical protein